MDSFKERVSVVMLIVVEELFEETLLHFEEWSYHWTKNHLEVRAHGFYFSFFQ